MIRHPELIAAYVTSLEAAGIESARGEIDKICVQVLGLAPNALPDWSCIKFTAEQQAIFEHAVRRRAARMPIERIFGKTSFSGLNIYLNEGVFRPYSETQAFIEHVQIMFENHTAPLRILDLGTGTGCILLALLQTLPQATGLGVDINPQAVILAGTNAIANNFQDRVSFRISDWDNEVPEQFDLIVSNPPRVATRDLQNLPPETRLYDPAPALDGGPDALHFYSRTMAAIPKLLNPDGIGMFQCDPRHATAIQKLFLKAGFHETEIKTGFAGMPVAIVIKNAPRAPRFRKITRLFHKFLLPVFAEKNKL